MTPHVAATLCLSSTGQTLDLEHGATLVLGRGTFVGITSCHISRRQVLVISNDNDITLIRQGTNRSLLDGLSLPKDKPHEYPITIDILPLDLQGDSVKMTRRQSASLQSPAPVTSPFITLTSNVTAPSVASYKGPEPEHGYVVTRASVRRLANIKESTMDRQASAQRRTKEDTAIRHLDIDDQVSDTTSDSEGDEDQVHEGRHSSVISAESSFVCDDLSDMDDGEHHFSKSERAPHPVVLL
ncbi:hypothetical protein BG011_008885 [Mortierella polycephala]|uniref:PNK FHA domain-containing protein n=1 Tax=Mortierella polycephala TaxID=41804 RepID=A0A9P6QDT0_9FUNG|nr:hypothetical protein BG011_008885 [Mortierella polycephala]